MIIKTSELIRLQKKTVLVDGCFDPLHVGHIDYFHFAAQFKLPVVCNIETDKYIKTTKNRPVLLPQNQRIQIIDSIIYINYSHLQTTSTSDVLKKLLPVKYIKGHDWKKKSLPQEELEACRLYHIEIAYTKFNLDSSADLIKRFLRQLKCL